MTAANDALAFLSQRWPLPSSPRPIVVIGAGSIVRDAHLPVYRRLGFPVAGIFDVNPDAARERAAAFALPRVFDSLAEAAATPGVVFDIAVPPQEIAGIVVRLPEGAPVLMQKPMGRDLDDARRIVAICRERRLTAAVNFQLRFAPNMLALRQAMEGGMLGRIADVDVRLNVYSPWDYWPFLKGLPRLEVVNHSIHYVDLIRLLLGEPRGVYCRGVRHPDLDGYPDVRTSMILDYGDEIRCSLVMNHTHNFGSRFAASELKVEGTKGAAIAKMGVNLNYPHGEPDELLVYNTERELSQTERGLSAREDDTAERGLSARADAADGWTYVPLRGSWFTEAFEGPMSNLQRFIAGEDAALVSPVDDAIRTMAVVEACYTSSASGGTPIPDVAP